jgi:poly(A) polymerase
MAQATYETGLVTLSRPTTWPPIRAIRAEHDRKLRRRMPHITLIYPFLSAGESEAVATRPVPA